MEQVSKRRLRALAALAQRVVVDVERARERAKADAVNAREQDQVGVLCAEHTGCNAGKRDRLGRDGILRSDRLAHGRGAATGPLISVNGVGSQPTEGVLVDVLVGEQRGTKVAGGAVDDLQDEIRSDPDTAALDRVAADRLPSGEEQ